MLLVMAGTEENLWHKKHRHTCFSVRCPDEVSQEVCDDPVIKQQIPEGEHIISTFMSSADFQIPFPQNLVKEITIIVK